MDIQNKKCGLRSTRNPQNRQPGSKNATLSFCLRDLHANALPLRHPSEWVSPKFCQRAVIQWTSASVIQIIKNVHILATIVRRRKYKFEKCSQFVGTHKGSDEK